MSVVGGSCSFVQRPRVGIIVMGLVWGGSMGKVGAFELVGGYEGVTGCI